MEILNMLNNVAEPTGMWANIIKWIFSSVGNYAITIIILTIAIKIILLPLDFYQRYITKANTKKQAKIQPEIDKINARYANNKDLLNQKTMELYKRENYNIIGTCVGMLVNLVLTMVIFFTLFGGINKMQYYTIDQEFLSLRQTYIEAVEDNYGAEISEDEIFNGTVELPSEVVVAANNAVQDKYKEIKTSFLWIKNVWIPDNYKSIVPDYEGYLKITNQKALSDGSSETLRKNTYDTVMGSLQEKYTGWNGYMILPMLAIISTVISTMIPTWIEKSKAKKRGVPYVTSPANNKMMLILMPVILGVFTFFYNSVFGLYIVVGALIGLMTSPLTTLLTDKIIEKKEERNAAKLNVSYSRKSNTVDITKNQNTTKKTTKNSNNSKKK